LEEYVLQKIAFQSNISSLIFVGFVIAIVIVIIQKIGIRSRTIPWISFILILILLVSNMGYLQNISPINLSSLYSNSSLMLEPEKKCPTPTKALQEFETVFDTNSVITKLNSFVDVSVWKIENLFDSCYKGKYTGQNPNWFYCDNLIVSRFETRQFRKNKL